MQKAVVKGFLLFTAQFYYINDSREIVVFPFLIRSLIVVLHFMPEKDISESVGTLPVYALKTGFLPWQMKSTLKHKTILHKTIFIF